MTVHENVDADKFKSIVVDGGASSSDLFLVDFKAQWCQPCHMLSPILKRIAEDKAQGVTLVTVDVDEQAPLSAAFQITAMPTVIAFKGGKPIKQCECAWS